MRQKGKGFFPSRTVFSTKQHTWWEENERREVEVRAVWWSDSWLGVMRMKECWGGSKMEMWQGHDRVCSFNRILWAFHSSNKHRDEERRVGSSLSLFLSLRACFMLLFSYIFLHLFESNSWRRLEILLTSNDSSENTDQRPAVKLNSDTHTHGDESDTVMVNEQICSDGS